MKIADVLRRLERPVGVSIDDPSFQEHLLRAINSAILALDTDLGSSASTLSASADLYDEDVPFETYEEDYFVAMVAHYIQEYGFTVDDPIDIQRWIARAKVRAFIGGQ